MKTGLHVCCQRTYSLYRSLVSASGFVLDITEIGLSFTCVYLSTILQIEDY